jgi:hypothetical protein
MSKKSLKIIHDLLSLMVSIFSKLHSFSIMFGHYKLNQKEKEKMRQPSKAHFGPTFGGQNIPQLMLPTPVTLPARAPQALARYRPPPLAPVRSSAPRNRSLSAVCRAMGAVSWAASGSTGPQWLAGGWGWFAAPAVR